MNKTIRSMNLGAGIAGLLIVILIAIAVNVILGNLNLRVDLTEEKLYTLSEGTRNILTNLQQPVTLKFFFSESDPKIPIGIKNYAQRVADLLDEYRIRSDGNVLVETYDPKPDSDAEDWAQRYGMAGQELGMMGPTLYMGIVAVQGGAEAAIPVLDPRAEELLEYNITRLITRVANPKKPVIGVLAGLPVLGIQAPPYAMPGQPRPESQAAWAAFSELKQDHTVRELDPTAESIPEDLDALVVVHPKELSDTTLFALDQFVLRGGRLMVFLDPLCVAEMEIQGPSSMGMPTASSDLDKLLAAWGVEYDRSRVVADLEASSRLRMGQGGQIQDSPVWLSLRRAHANQEDILTSQLESIMMPYAGSFKVSENADRKVTPLLFSSETSGPVDTMTAQYSVDGVRRAFKSGLERLPLAVRLHGKLTTAFPDGKPDAAKDEGEDPKQEKDEKAEQEATKEGEGTPAATHLTESAAPTTVILVADVDMIFDRFCVRAMDFLGHKMHQAVNDNLSFFLNAVEQISGSTDLIGIRARGKTQRPFDVVLALERRAQEKYMAEERRLQDTLREAQQRLDALQREKDSSQQYILSPEQKKAIDNFQKQVLETKEKLKLVRRKLRADIELLGFKLKSLNILFMPVLVAVGGVLFWVIRRKRQR